MALKEDFEETGNFLFKWRSYLPLLLFPILLLGMKHFEYMGQSHRLDQLWEVVCLFVSFFGLGIRIFTIGYAPHRTSGRNTKCQVAKELNTTGIYSMVRHPLYLGNFIIWFGISMFLHLWWVSLIFILIFWIYYERIMFAEEAFLRKNFGVIFEKWANHTPAFLPSFKNYKSSKLSFSFKKTLRKEYTGFFVIISTFTFLEIIGDLVIKGKLSFDLMWGVIFSAGATVYITIKIIKKKTRLLKEE